MTRYRPVVEDALDATLLPMEAKAHHSKSPLAADLTTLIRMVRRLVKERDAALLAVADSGASKRSGANAIHFYLDEDKRVACTQVLRFARAAEKGGELHLAASLYEHARAYHWSDEAERGARRCHRLSVWDSPEPWKASA